MSKKARTNTGRVLLPEYNYAENVTSLQNQSIYRAAELSRDATKTFLAHDLSDDGVLVIVVQRDKTVRARVFEKSMAPVAGVIVQQTIEAIP